LRGRLKGNGWRKDKDNRFINIIQARKVNLYKHIKEENKNLNPIQKVGGGLRNERDRDTWETGPRPGGGRAKESTK